MRSAFARALTCSTSLTRRARLRLCYVNMLPDPCRRCLPIVPLPRLEQGDGPIALRQSLLRQGVAPDEVVLEEREERRGQGRAALLLPLAGPDGPVLQRPSKSLDAEPDGFHPPPATAVEPWRPQGRRALHQREDGGDCVAGHHHRHVDLLGGAHGMDAVLQRLVEDALVKKDQGRAPC